MKRKCSATFIVLMIATVAYCTPCRAADWSVTELQYQRGRLKAPSYSGGEKATTHILTLQHASGWKYGDTFFFVDILDDKNTDGFNDRDVYSEIYLNFSMGKITGKRVGGGALKDVGIIMGLNADADANVLKLLPGIRLSWDVPGFAFLNTDLTAYMDKNSGASSGGAPTETNSWMLDMNWAYPVSSRFSIDGHMEYIGKRKNEFGGDVPGWFLAQPQFRYDIGAGLFHDPGRLFAGIEWQVWSNKLGAGDTSENALQFLLVWRL